MRTFTEEEVEEMLIEKEKSCDTCNYGMRDINDFPCNQCKRNFSDKWETKRNPTNFEDIKAMDIGDLASFLIAFENKFGTEYEGWASCVDWLQSEAE